VTRYAPGWPGSPARWTSSAKSGVGTALGAASRVWFTLSHGILNEVYYPRVDQACVRDLGLVVTDGRSFFSEEKRHTQTDSRAAKAGVPVFELRNTCTEGRYRIEKTVLADPTRDVVLVHVRFVPLRGELTDYKLYALLAPHLGNQGAANTAWLDEIEGAGMLLASRDALALALACSAPWTARSAGFVGASDGWQDLSEHKVLSERYDRAENGNVALVGEIPIEQAGAGVVLALAFGPKWSDAAHAARASLLDGFDAARATFESGWRAWNRTLALPTGGDLERTSAAVLRAHEDKHVPGGVVASLSIPWGMAKGDGDLGGYHLVWPRDLVETAGGLLAVGAHTDALRILSYLESTQSADGRWVQNMWLDGSAYWPGLQMDETALPILLVDLADKCGCAVRDRYWPMVRRAAEFIVANGPASLQDRWEEDAGYAPFTLGAEIAALIVAADLADHHGDHDAGGRFRAVADAWNARIEEWTYFTGTDLARRVGVDGYYARIAPSTHERMIVIRNRPPSESKQRAASVISPDALALVRFGIRRADDPRIVNTVRVIDALLRVETPRGPAWRRYNGDGYGEHEDGAPFDGTGVGRPWPLLTGERAHFELAAGRSDEATRLAGAFERFADHGLLPEQVWDGPDVPSKELRAGGPSGSAMPLAWAHAEYLKLRRSLADKRVFDLPRGVHARYAGS